MKKYTVSTSRKFTYNMSTSKGGVAYSEREFSGGFFERSPHLNLMNESVESVIWALRQLSDGLVEPTFDIEYTEPEHGGFATYDVLVTGKKEK